MSVIKKSPSASKSGNVYVRVVKDFDYKSPSSDSHISGKAGDEWRLREKTNNDWWLVCGADNDGKAFYIPVIYVEEFEKSTLSVERPKVPVPKPRHSTIEVQSALDELDSVLDEVGAADSCFLPIGDTAEGASSLPKPDYELNDSGDEALYINCDSLKVDSTGSKLVKHSTESDTSDYRTDSRGSLNSENISVHAGASAESKVSSPKLSKRRIDIYEQPQYCNIDEIRKPQSSVVEEEEEEEENYANLNDIQDAIRRAGSNVGSPQARKSTVWTEKRSSSDQVVFINRVTDEKWIRCVDDHNRTYYFNEALQKSVWSLDEVGVQSPPVATGSVSSLNSLKRFQPSAVSVSEVKDVRAAVAAGAAAPAPVVVVEKPLCYVQRPRPVLVEKQNNMNRIKTIDNGKKTKKSWSYSYTVLCGESITFYKEQKEQKAAKLNVAALGKVEGSLSIRGATLARKSTEEKKPINYIEVTLVGNTQYWLSCSDGALLDHWFLSLNNNITVLNNQKPEEAAKTVAAHSSPSNTGLQVEGIYRTSGSVAEVQKLKTAVDLNEYYDLTSLTWDIHVISSALKQFFRKLPEPLFPLQKFDQFLNAFGMPDRQSKIAAMSTLLRQLPQINIDTITVLFRHLNVVVHHSSQNLMNCNNLAIVFGPTLLSPDDAGNNLVVSTVKQGQLVEFMLSECQSLFNV